MCFFLKTVKTVTQSSRDCKDGNTFILHEPLSAFSISEHNLKMFYTRKCMQLRKGQQHKQCVHRNGSVFLLYCSKALAVSHSWTCSSMGYIAEPLMERSQEEFRAVKRRSGLETEMIILVFFKNCPATSFSCDLPLSG